MACALAANVGCKTFGGKLRNPFAKKPTEPQAAQQIDAPGESIQQAAFEQPSPEAKAGMTKDTGKSIAEAADERSFWQKAGDAAKTENIAKRWKKMIGRGPNEAVARQAYADAEAAFRAKNYEEAVKKYAIAADRWPDSMLEEDAMFMLAESYFFCDRYSKTSDTYTKMLKKYENSRYMDKVMVRSFAIGKYWDEVGKKHKWLVPNFSDKTRPLFDTQGHAIAVFEGMRMNDPTGPLADDACLAAGVSHFMSGHWEDADHQFDTLRKEYPRSEHQVEAHLLGLKTKLKNYQGSQYDERPLTEADKLVDSTLLQFSRDLPEERERLQATKRSIRDQRAEREYINGEYYYNRKCYRAARYYYEHLIKQFPETPSAKLAEARMEETKNYPPDPPNYWGWLGKIFGERKRTYN
ncbi:MAG TPA: outer membrane protein assembly factor BamD [Pirellulales bacterium]|nr:outer membrane protein assembly factor BamD [Pirellulales bacterium]